MCYSIGPRSLFHPPPSPRSPMLTLSLLYCFLTPAVAQEELPPAEDTTSTVELVPYKPHCKGTAAAIGCVTMYGGIAVGLGSLIPMKITEDRLHRLRGAPSREIPGPVEWNDELARYKRDRRTYMIMGIAGLSAYAAGATITVVDTVVFVNRDSVTVQVSGRF